MTLSTICARTAISINRIREVYRNVIIYRKWDSLTEEERLQVLEFGRYTGMLSTEEDLDFANLYQPASRDNMLATLQDELENQSLGFNVEDTNHYIIKFKNNDAVVHSFDLAPTSRRRKSNVSNIFRQMRPAHNHSDIH